MTPERWKQVEEIFNSALDLAPEARPGFLAQVCGGDPALRLQVEALIRSDERAGSFIEAPAFAVGSVTALQNYIVDQTGSMIGRRVGAYQIVSELGRGGMGAVFLATRADDEFEQRVAIKLVKRGMDTDFILRRFRNERQILASLDHPNIGRLFDGGTTEDGLPYFVMEYIQGQPVNRYCDDVRLTVGDRLRMFRRVCAALSYAHQNLVVHRDIKPSNILVTSDGVPKLLDFGIAKILNPEVSADTVDPTATAMQLMTPRYASPEQLRGATATQASDIYSLGVLLFELLTGRHPYRLDKRAPHEIARIVCEEEPEKPSAAVSRTVEVVPSDNSGEGDTITPEAVGWNRKATPEALRRALAAGLDQVVMKAICKEPHRRYSTVEEFSADIGRYLGGQPVTAPGHTAAAAAPAARAKESAAGKGAAGAAKKSIAVLPFKLLHAAAGVETAGNFLGTGLADALITRLSNLRGVLVRPTSSVLRFAEDDGDPVMAGHQLGVDYVLDGHILKVGDRVRVTVQLVQTERNAPLWAAQFDENYTDILTLHDSVSEQVARALVPKLTGEEWGRPLRRGTDNPAAYEAYLRGRIHWHTYTEEGLATAITHFYEAIAADPNYASAYSGVADYYNWLGVYGVLPPRECFSSAKEAAQKAIELDETLAEAYASLGFAAWAYDWDIEESERLFARAFELNPNYPQAHEWYAHVCSTRGRHAEAVAEMKKAMESDPRSAPLSAQMAFTLHMARRYDESLRYLQWALDIDHDYYIALQGFGFACIMTGREREAVERCRKAVEVSGRATLTLWTLAHALAVTGEEAEARRLLAELVEISRHRYVPPCYMALVHTGLGEPVEAFRWLEKAVAEHDYWLQWLPVEPRFDALRSDPRYERIVRRIRPLGEGEEEEAAEAEAGQLPAAAVRVASVPAGGRAGESAKEVDERRPARMPGGPAQAPAEVAAAAARLPRRALPARPSTIVAAALALACVLAVTAWYALRPAGVGAPAPGDARGRQSLVPPAGPSGGAAATKSIAVLPFKSENATDAEQSVCVGLADDLTAKFGQVRQLEVRPSSAVRRYLNSDIEPQQAGRELGVEYVLSGELYHYDGDRRVQVSARLTRAADNKVLWAEIFDERLADLTSLQGLVSTSVLRALTLELTSEERTRLGRPTTASSEAYQLYLAGRYHWGKRTADGLRQAIGAFKQAIEKDPNYALAYAGLADCHALSNWYFQPPPPDAFARARDAATKALALDDTLSEAHASVAFVKFHYERDWEGSEVQFRRAIELNPSYATAHHWFAFNLSAMGRHEEALAEIRRAQELDPRSVIINTAIGNVLYHARRYDEAIEQCRRTLEIDPGVIPAYTILRWSYEKKGMFTEALAAYQKERAYSGDSPALRLRLAHLQAQSGAREEARALVTELTRTPQARAQVSGYEVAVIYALLGERDTAFEWLARPETERTIGFTFATVDPNLDDLRPDPRFNEILRRAKIVQ